MSTPPGQKSAPKANQTSPTQNDLLSQYNTLLNNALSGTGSSSTSGKIADNSLIYMGRGGNAPSPTTGPNGDIQHGGGYTGDNNMSYADARNLPSQWYVSDPNQLKKLVNTGILNKVPGFSVGMGLPDIMSAWDDLVQASYALNQGSSGKNWTPWDVLNTYGNSKNNLGTVRQGDWLYDASTGAKLKYVGPRTKTTTSRSVDLQSTEDVKALTTQVLTQALGRAPTSKEVAQYKSTINSQENSNPSLSTTTSTYNDQGEVSDQSTKTSGGFDSAAQQQLVQDQTAKTAEYAKYQSGTTYWNAMMQMLTGG